MTTRTRSLLDLLLALVLFALLAGSISAQAMPLNGT